MRRRSTRTRAAAPAFVFQEPTLMPWASVFDNVWLPLRLAHRSRAECALLVRQVLATVGLTDFQRAYPAQLPGGMKMRAWNFSTGRCNWPQNLRSSALPSNRMSPSRSRTGGRVIVISLMR